LKKLKRLISYVLITCLAGILGVFLVAPTSHANTPLVCNMSTVTGDDDGSFPMTLPFSLQLGNTNYNQIYYSTNGLMSFGRPDGNFSSYPSTPSVTLAGRDWVSFGPGAYTSYGYNQDSFCIEWSVRPFPQSSGPLTQIRLVVNVFPNGGWHGEITTLGWIPPDIRRGIVWEQNGTPLPIGAAFDVNGGVPIEVPPAPPPTSFTQPPVIPTQCWNGSTVYAPATCPPVPPDIVCWDSSTVPWNGTCPTEPPPIQCWNGTSVPWNGTCPTEPVFVCWNGSIVHYESDCLPIPPPITCWDGSVISWNQTCPQVPPLVECWDGSEVNWNEQCPPVPPTTPEGAYVIQEGSVLNVLAPDNKKVLSVFGYYGDPNDGSRGQDVSSILSTLLVGQTSAIIEVSNSTFENDPAPGTPKVLIILISYEDIPVEPSPTASPEPQPSESQTPTLEPSPQPTEPSPQPSETFEPPLEPSPNPTPSESESVVPEPQPSQTQSPEPEPSSPSEPAPSPEESPTPDPSPEATDPPSDNNITETTDEEIGSFVDSFTESGSISDAETEQLIDNFLTDGFISEDEVSGLLDSLTEDGVLTEDEKELLVDVILEQADGNAISTELINELGLDYEDLPDDQPVMLDNGVILFAEVADALEIFENPSEILGAIFTDPSKALTAVANIGADMTPEQRKESQTIVVASIIVGQVISTTNLITGRIR
jgi:hypothetical protein